MSGESGYGAAQMELAKDLGEGRITLRLVLRAFRYRNYRLYFTGQGLSLFGTWMQHTAMSWLVYRLSGSALLLGLTGFAGQIPSFLLTPVAGVFADRVERRRLLLWTQVFAMLQATAMAALVITGEVRVWHIIALSFVLGTVNAFDIPARHSFVVDMVDNRDDIGNAIALNSSMFHGARLAGPAVAGLLIGSYGEGICFILNAVSFLAVIVALLAMKIRPREKRLPGSPVLRELFEGLDYAFASVPIKNVLLLVGLVSLAGMPYIVLMPVFARDILGGGPQTLGFLMASSGMGAFAGTLFLASRRNAQGLGKIVYGAAIIYFLGIVAFSLSKTLSLSMICLFAAGLGLVVQVASGNTILQTIVDEDKRGRVMSLFNMAFLGMAPFGNLLAGGMASGIGVPFTLLLCAVVCLAGSLRFAGKLKAFP
ncbi:MAG TPA: MFS transporter [Geobacteraceae bacterium]|nr:MFS transporter [Geobacteraceae bacterium]